MDLEPAMPRSRGVAGYFTTRRLLGREHSHESDGRLSAKSAIIVIGGISLLLWVLIVEMVFI